MKRIVGNDFLGAQPIFLLEITWGGREFRFSSFPLDLDTETGGSIHFFGGLEDPEWVESMAEISSSPENNSIPIEVVFPVNLLEEFFQFGRSLETATGELSIVTERKGVILQTYEARTRLFSGDVMQPIIGDPERPNGYAAFSLERKPNNKPVPIIKENGFFEFLKSLDAITPVTPGWVSWPFYDFSDNKVYPVVFGKPDKYVSTGQQGNVNLTNLKATPAFIVYAETQSVGGFYELYTKFWLCISLGSVDAATVTIYDYQGNSKSGLLVQEIETEEGNVISYVICQFADYNGGSPIIVDGIVNPWITENGNAFGFNQGSAETDDPKYWVSWSGGGGILNTNGTGYLEGAGDVLLHFMRQAKIEIDFNAWANVAGYLNGWKLAGYINDPEMTAYKFLEDNVFPLVPVYAVNGPDGLRPIIPLIYLSRIPRKLYSIKIDSGFYFVAPIEIENEPDDIVNRLHVRYAYSAAHEKLLANLRILPDFTEAKAERMGSNICAISRTRFGDRFQEVEFGYIVDFSTALRAAQYIVRKSALPRLTIEIQADVKYAWLQLGDIVALDAEDFFMQDFKMQIIEKSWENGGWLFKMEFQENIIINRRV